MQAISLKDTKRIGTGYSPARRVVQELAERESKAAEYRYSYQTCSILILLYTRCAKSVSEEPFFLKY